jgi:hypothetical protein
VGVGVTPGPVGGTLQTLLAARDQGCRPNNRLQAVQFTRLANATVDVGAPAGVLVTTAPTTVALPSQPASLLLTVNRVAAGQPTTVELVVTDSCGTWRTFVGGGPTAF